IYNIRIPQKHVKTFAVLPFTPFAATDTKELCVFLEVAGAAISMNALLSMHSCPVFVTQKNAPKRLSADE
ncbi:MAG: hypothetical protein K2O97_09805, partial [Acetatifactor sp.]|nr:hypothetical protein [Acetatifactor sp.]